MAKFVLTAQLRLQAPDNIRQVVNQIQQQLSGVNVKIDAAGATRATKEINALTNATNKAASSASKMGAAFGVSLKRFAAFSLASRAIGLFTSKLSQAIDDAIKFQDEIVKLSQITGQSTSDLRGLGQTIGNLAIQYGVASEEIVQVTNTLAQAGIQAGDLEIAIKALTKTKLAPSFGDIRQTTEGVVAILAQFGEGVNSLERQLSSINVVAAQFAVESGDLIDVIRRTGGVFKASGGSLEELLALFTSIRATTRESAESIGTGLRTILTRIQRPSTITYLKELGVELTDLDGKFVGPYEAVRRLSQALADIPAGDVRFIRIAEELGGFRQIGKVIPLLQQFAVAEKARQAALAGGDSLTKDAAKAQESLLVQFTKTREEFLKLIRDIADTTSFKVLVKTTLSLTSTLIKLADAFKPIIPLLAAFAAIKFAKSAGNFAAGLGSAFAGMGKATTKSGGGKIQAFASGGMVPGSGNRDTVPAMLTPGEFVIRKSSVKKLGADRLAAMNNNRYADGGYVVKKDFIDKGQIKDKQLKEDLLNIVNKNAKSFGKKIKKQKEIPQYNSVKGSILEGSLRAAGAGEESTGKDFDYASWPGNIQGFQIPKGTPTDAKASSRAASKAEFIKKIANYQRPERGKGGLDTKIFAAAIFEPGNDTEIKISQEEIGKAHIKKNKENFRREQRKNRKDEKKARQTAVSDQKKFSGGLIQRFVTGGEAEKVDPVQAKIAEIQRETGQTISVNQAQRILNNPNLQPGTIKKILAEKAKQEKASQAPEFGAAFLIKDVEAPKELRETTIGDQKVTYKLNSAFIDSADAENIKNKIVLDKANTAVNDTANYIGKAFGANNFSGNQGVPNIKAITGSIFEAALSKLTGASILGDDDQRTFDFPTGLGPTATQIFGADAAKLSGIPTDAKYASSTPALESIREKVRTYMSGKSPQKFAKGGAASDTVPALLTPGEFVINKQAASRIGYGNLNRMNKHGVTGFAKGGPVGGTTTGTTNNKETDDETPKKGIEKFLISLTAAGVGLTTAFDQLSGSIKTLTGANDEEVELYKSITQSLTTFATQLLILNKASAVGAENLKKFAEGLTQKRQERETKVKEAQAALSPEGLKKEEQRKKNEIKTAKVARTAEYTTMNKQTMAKVDQIMANVDKLETKKQALVQQKTAASTPNEIKELNKQIRDLTTQQKAQTQKAAQFAKNAGFENVNESGLLQNAQYKNQASQKIEQEKQNRIAAANKEYDDKLYAKGGATAADITRRDEKIRKAEEKAKEKLDILPQKIQTQQQATLGERTKTGKNFEQVQAKYQSDTSKIIGDSNTKMKGFTDVLQKSNSLMGKFSNTVSNGMERVANAGVRFNQKFGGAIQAAVAGLGAVQTALNILQEKAQKDFAKAVEAGDMEAVRKASGAQAGNEAIQGIVNPAMMGATMGAALGPIGMLLGGVGGAMFGALTTDYKEIERQKNKRTAEANIGIATRQQEGLTKKFMSGKGAQTFGVGPSGTTNFAARVGGISANVMRDINKLQPEEQEAAREKLKQTEVAAAEAIGARSGSEEELTNNINVMSKATATNRAELLEAAKAARANAEAQKALNKANLDALKISSAFDKANTAVNNLIASFETGGSSLDTVITDLEAAQSNMLMGEEGKKAAQEARQAVMGALPAGTQDSELGKSISRSFDQLENVSMISQNIGTKVSGLQLSAANPEEAKKQLEAAIESSIGTGPGSDEARQIARKKVAELGPNVANVDLSAFIKELQGDLGKLGNGALEAAKKLRQHEQTMATLTQRRKEAEERYIKVAQQSIDTQIDAAKSFEEFGGAKFTPQQELGGRLAQFNLEARQAGLGAGLATGGADEIRAMGDRIVQGFAGLTREAVTGGVQGKRAFAGAAGIDKDKRQELQRANEALINFTKQRIGLLKQELEIVKKKNELERSSLDKLLGGDVEGFLQEQQASAAASFLRSGDTALAGMFGTQALGAGLKSLEGQGLSAKEMETISGTVLSKFGVTNPRSAQIMAGTTPEEEALKSQGRELSKTMGELAQQTAQMESMNVQASEVMISAAQVTFERNLAAGQAAIQTSSNPPVAMRRGGLIYANRGIFVPRGTDTVPAMLTPGEFVVRREAVQAGNNLQMLKAMNNNPGSPAASVAMAKGGQVKYYQAGGMATGGINDNVISSLNTIFTSFADSVNKLQNMQLSVKLDATNVNVNFNGTSFLANLTDTIKSEVLSAVQREIPNIKTNNAGQSYRDTSTLA